MKQSPREELLDAEVTLAKLNAILSRGPDYLQADNTQEYIIVDEDFQRNTPKESKYLLKYRATILLFFKSQCAICFNRSNGLEFDHWLLPKSKGGNFELRHRSGHRINNAVPLCVTCNRKKQAKDYREVCSPQTIKRIKAVNELINRIINTK